MSTRIQRPEEEATERYVSCEAAKYGSHGSWARQSFPAFGFAWLRPAQALPSRRPASVKCPTAKTAGKKYLSAQAEAGSNVSSAVIYSQRRSCPASQGVDAVYSTWQRGLDYLLACRVHALSISSGPQRRYGRPTRVTARLQYDCTLSSSSMAAMAMSCTSGFSSVQRWQVSRAAIGAISGPSMSASSLRFACCWKLANDGSDGGMDTGAPM